MAQSRKFGRYEIQAALGQGGMAMVYRAHDPRFDREVALKVLPRELVHDATFRQRFDREARTIARLEHYAIVPVYDFGEHEGQPYLVMRYMMGGSLAGKLQDGAMPLLQIAPILARLADALDYAHSLGVVHRDLKPGNVLFDDQGNAFLSDFGIAKLAESSHTLTGSAIIGTPAYMSPEQVQGEEDIDGRSDVYALGIMLFQMLTGEMPFQANTPVKQLMAHVLNPVPDVLAVRGDLPPACSQVVAQALAKSKGDRYETAGKLAYDVSMIATSEMARPDVAQPAAPATAAPAPEAAPTAVQEPEVLEPSVLEPTVFEETAVEPKPFPPTEQGTLTAPQEKRPLPEPPPAPIATQQRSIPLWLWGVGGVILLLFLGVVVRSLLAPAAEKEPVEPLPSSEDSTPMGAYIQEMWGAGSDVTSLAYRPGSWAVVMSTNTGYGQQIWHVSEESPLPKIQEMWTEGYEVTELAYGDGHWVVIMSENAGLGTQLWHFTPDSPQAFIQSKWEEGYDVTSLAYGNGGWGLVLSQDAELGEQFWHRTGETPLPFIEENWQQGFDLTSLTYGDRSWALITSADSNLGRQVLHRTPDSPVDYMQEQWARGFDVTSLAYGDGTWALVLSENANLGTQTWHTTEQFR